MTEGDSTNVRLEPPLKLARTRLGWSQAAAMRRFQDAVTRAGDAAPTGASLKRMFAYWETGERAVTVPAYRKAFVEIYAAPPEALGFSPPDETGRLAEIRSRPLELVDVDADLVILFESQTQYLRDLDRRLGSAAQALLAGSHVEQISSVLHHCVGRHRGALAAALAEAAALAGWQALDRGDVGAAWDYHETGKAAASESGSLAVAAHVLAQQGFVLLDCDQPALAVDAMNQANEIARGSPPLLRAWLGAAKAEGLAAVGDAGATRRSLEEAQALLSADGEEELPYLMLSEEHLARWRGHCFARLGDPEAIESLPRALAAESDSVRAAVSLHADMALALLNAGLIAEAQDEATKAMTMAERFGSARQRKRLLRILESAERQDV